MATPSVDKANDDVGTLSEGVKKKVTFASDVAADNDGDEGRQARSAQGPDDSSANNMATAGAGTVDSAKGWPVQRLDQLDISKLSPLDPVVMHRQATINIGTIGHVAHGKSTVVKAITGVQTVRFKTELERNITIKLGYANAKIFKCDNPQCKKPGSYTSFGSNAPAKPKCPKCASSMTLVRHVSFVDCFYRNTQVMMCDGTLKSIGDIQVDDYVMGSDGTPKRVNHVTSGIKQLYEVKYGDSFNKAIDEQTTEQEQSLETQQFVCTGGHLLVLCIEKPTDLPTLTSDGLQYRVKTFSGYKTSMQCRHHYFNTYDDAMSFYNSYDKSPITFEMTVESYLNAPISIQKRCQLLYSQALEFNQTQCSDSIATSTYTAEEVANAYGKYLMDAEYNEEIIKHIATERSNHKHIPHELKMQSIAFRQALLNSIIATASCTSANKQDQMLSMPNTPQNSVLMRDIVWIMRSLGIKCKRSTTLMQIDVHGKEVSYQHIRFTMPTTKAHINIIPFAARAVELGPYAGFSIDNDSDNRSDSAGSQFLLSDFIVAHNCPGHDILMATMLNGAAVMDAALLLVAGNETCPQPQTSEHLAAVEIMKLKNILILQNKIDLVKSQEAAQQYERIQDFIRGTVAEGSPIIPISAQLKYNIEVICEYITTKIPVPVRDFTSSPELIVIRSFDVNKPGEEVSELKGGVAGGSILKGILRVGQEIEIRPGIVTKDAQGNVKCIPIFSSIVSLFAEHNDLAFAVPGGLIGCGTKIDPTLTRADRLVGQVLGEVGKLPDIFTELEISFFLLRRLLGVKIDTSKASSSSSASSDEKKRKENRIKKLEKGEILMVNIGSTSTGARILQVKGDLAKVQLISPVCTSEGEKLALSRRVEKHWRLIGWGRIRKGTKVLTGAVNAADAARDAQSAASNSQLATDQYDSMEGDAYKQNHERKASSEGDEEESQENSQ